MSTELAVRPLASAQLATLIGMESGTMLDTIKAQCFKTDASKVTNEQLAAFVSVASAMQVNPLLPGMLYAYPIQGGGIIPIMGPDGVYKKLTEHPDIDSWETTVYPEDVSLPPTHATTKIWRKGRERPVAYTALLSEWRIESNPNWRTRPRHFLALRSLKHAARQIIHGLPYDEDDRAIMANEVNVTGTGEGDKPADRPAPPPRAKKGASAVADPKPANAAIDVETLPPKVEPAAPVVADAPAGTKTIVERANEIDAAKTAEPAKTEAAPTQSQGPRTSLADKEELTTTLTVEKVYALIRTVKKVPTPCVQAVVKGGFAGTIHQFGGATLDDKQAPVASPPWKEGAVLKAAIYGRLNTINGEVMVVVKSVEEASPATPADEVD